MSAKVVIAKEVKRSKTTKSFAFEFSPISFPSHGGEIFRAIMKSVEEGVLLWLECKKTKQQWQGTVTSVADCGPAGVPEEAVIQFLKRAFELRVTPFIEGKSDREDPVVDLLMEGEDTKLVLTLCIMNGVWKPEFVFSVLPIGLDKVDVLEAKLRDAQDEIQTLRALVADTNARVSNPVFLSLTSDVACPNDQIVVWKRHHSYGMDSFFILSDDNRQLTVMRAGVYQINVRLAGTSTSNGSAASLQVKGVDVARCPLSDPNHYQNTAEINEIMILSVADVLQVKCLFNYGSLPDPLANRFAILYLGGEQEIKPPRPSLPARR